MNKNLTKKISLVIVILIAFCGIIAAYTSINNGNSVIKNTTAKTNTVELGYKPTDEEKSILKKSYEDLNNHEFNAFNDLDKKYDSMSDAKRQSIKTDIERLRKEKNDYLKECIKQSEQNKQLYEDFTKEIESDYPDMNVISITGKDKKKSLSMTMKLLYNITATERKCSELTVMKETRIKEVGINTIMISVKDKNGEVNGVLMFDLQNGRFEPTVNTLK